MGSKLGRICGNCGESISVEVGLYDTNTYYIALESGTISSSAQSIADSDTSGMVEEW